MSIYILGGGPTALALADGIVQNSALECTVFEQNAQLGGLAQTLKWKEHGFHDLGPHKIFTCDEALMQRVKSLLPEADWLVCPKKSSIFINGHYLPYPPSPFSLYKVYGPAKFLMMCLDFAAAQLSALIPTSAPDTFESDLRKRVGRSMYQVLFRPIAQKLWGDPRELDIKLSQSRVQTPSIFEIAARLLGISKSSSFEALEFHYPRGGLTVLWKSIADRTESHCEFLLNTEVIAIDAADGMVKEIRCRDKLAGSEHVYKVSPEDWVFSTIPLPTAAKLLGSSFSQESRKLLEQVVQLNDLLLVFVKIDQPKLLRESWVFVPDPEVAFHRLSEQSSFDAAMSGDGSILCCEIMSNELRRMKEKSDEELTTLCLQGLSQMQLSNFSVIDTRVIRLPRSYPVFRPGFEAKLQALLQEFDASSNFRTIGRQGAFSYIGTLDAMDIGYGAAQWVLEQKDSNLGAAESWEKERRRTNYYPVLD